MAKRRTHSNIFASRKLEARNFLRRSAPRYLRDYDVVWAYTSGNPTHGHTEYYTHCEMCHVPNSKVGLKIRLRERVPRPKCLRRWVSVFFCNDCIERARRR